MYDWANSVYSLVISTVLFPLYYEAVTKNETNEVLFLGRYWENTVVYSYVIAASYLTISILSPYLAAMADRTGRRKVFMRTFMTIGALSTSCMGLFTAANPWLGLYLAFLASVGFTGSIVFYNSFLPERGADVMAIVNTIGCDPKGKGDITVLEGVEHQCDVVVLCTCEIALKRAYDIVWTCRLRNDSYI